MRTYESMGTICVKDDYGFVYAVSSFKYLIHEDESFEYQFRPNYSVVSLLSSDIFQGIPGLNLDLRKEVYSRVNRIPTFVSERVPSEKREDYYELLEEAGLPYMDPVLYLEKTPKQYSGDNLFVIPYVQKKSVTIDGSGRDTNTFIIRDVLKNLCLGHDIVLDSLLIDDANRSEIFKILSYLYKRSVKIARNAQAEGILTAKHKGKYCGRKPVEVDRLKFIELQDKVLKKEMTAKDAASSLGVSIDKYYRYKKQLQNQNHTLLQKYDE